MSLWRQLSHGVGALVDGRAKRRGIVLMHDVHDDTVDMVKYVLPKLKAEGYRFAALVDVPSVRRAIQSSAGE